jgi:uncharacterized cupin superfamily protein
VHQVAGKILASPVPDTALDPAPIPAEDIISGDPQSSMAILWRSDDLKLYNGIWECTPGVFTLSHPGETVCCVQGSATITPEGGEPVTLGPGDMAYIPEGTVARWEVHETIRKAFHSHDSSGTMIAGL